MAIPNDSYLLWMSAFFYISASVYLIRKIKREHTLILYPISIYLLGIAIFFTLMGIFQIYKSAVIAFLAALAIVIGASTMVRFPLKLELPHKERVIYIVLLILSFILVGYGFTTGEIPFMMRIAHGIAFVLAGLVTIGYIIYTGILTKSVRTQSFSTGVSLGLCCVVAHGLVAFQLFPLIGFGLLGLVTLKLPMIFALLSPLAFLYVVIIDKVIKPNVSNISE